MLGMAATHFLDHTRAHRSPLQQRHLETLKRRHGRKITKQRTKSCPSCTFSAAALASAGARPPPRDRPSPAKGMLRPVIPASTGGGGGGVVWELREQTQLLKALHRQQRGRKENHIITMCVKNVKFKALVVRAVSVYRYSTRKTKREGTGHRTRAHEQKTHNCVRWSSYISASTLTGCHTYIT